MAMDIKMGLLWEPAQFLLGKPYFSLLTITRKEELPPIFKQGALNKKNILQVSAQWSPRVILALENLSDEENAKAIAAIVHQLKKAGNNPSVQNLIQKAITKLHYDRIRLFVEQCISVPLYQKALNPQTSKWTISSCTFDTSLVTLEFDIVKLSGELHVLPMVIVHGQRIDVDQWQIYGYMLVQGNRWHMLSLKDFYTLEWFKKANAQQYASQPDALSEKIIVRLEENNKVNRNNYFTTNEVVAVPECSILFNELSGNFLMLTPRWEYDGFTVEGNWQEREKKKIKGKEYTILRDETAETQFKQYLQALHPDFPAQALRGFYFLSFVNARKKQWFLKTYRKLLKDNIAIKGLDMLQHFRYSPHDAVTTVAIQKQTPTNIDLEVHVCFGEEEIPLLNIQKMLLAEQRNVVLKDDSIAVFSDEWFRQYGKIFKHGIVFKNRLSIKPWILIGSNVATKDDSLNAIEAIVPETWRHKWLQWQSDEYIFSVPERIHTTLRPYQQKGFEWLVLLSEIEAGACLADDMGLGKTLQTICFLAYQAEKTPQSNFLIVCPASLLYNWQKEIEKFAPSLPTLIYSGNKRDLTEFPTATGAVLITSYHTLRQDIADIRTLPWQTAVIDESHNIKNPQAQITKAVYEIEAQHRIALSGTPVMNNTFDLYSQLQFVVPGLLGNREFFKREYAHPIDRHGDAVRAAELRDLTNPFILRRTKKQVASELPEKTESVLWCEMEEGQKSFYEEVKAEIQDSIFLGIKNNGLERNKLNILQGILKLRQVCDAPILVNNYSEYTACTDSIKIDRLMGELARLKESGSKALVFSQYTGMLDLIATRCQVEDISFFHFDGSTPIEKRNEMVTAFQSEESSETAFLISLKSGNAGLTLTAADYVFLIDPWWNHAVEQQAIDRTHRIGQTKNVFAYKMICKGSVEEKIIALQQKKKSISEELVTAEEGFVKNLSEEDVAYLFS